MYGNDQYTKLLIPGRGVNNSTAITDMCGKTITVNGNTKIVRPPTGNGYMVFDGSGDYLSIPYSTDLDVSGDISFTLQFYVYIISGSNVVLACNANASSPYTGWFLQYYNNKLTLNNYTTTVITSSVNLSNNTWVHVALVRNASTDYITMYFDGVSVGSWSGSLVNYPEGDWRFGSYINNYYHTGYMANICYDKGIARWTDTFTPPTTPTVDSYTKLYIKGDDGGTTFADYSGTSKTVTPNGNIYSYKNKFYGSSIYFDGTGDYLSLASSSDFAFGTGNFTIDCYIYLLSLDSDYGHVIFSGRTDVNNILVFCINLSHNEPYIDFGEYVSGSWSWYARYETNLLAINNWYHIAIVRNGTSSNCLKFYINGVLQTANSNGLTTQSIGTHNNYFIGGLDTPWSASPWRYFYGYLSGLRVNKGIARWTSDFTPPARPYGLQGLF